MASPRRGRHEDGSGLIGSLFGAIVFLSFLTLATHVLIGLYATSVATSLAWDATYAVATASDPGDPAVRSAAESDVRTGLRGLRDVRLTWHSDATGALGLEVAAERPALLPKALARPAGLTRIHRTVWVREEIVR